MKEIFEKAILTYGQTAQEDVAIEEMSELIKAICKMRQVTVINCLQGDVLFQMTGKMSITADTEDNQLEIVVEDENGEYKKHFIGLSDNVTYVVEDVTSGDVNQYKYTLNFNPKMWLPEISTIE